MAKSNVPVNEDAELAYKMVQRGNDLIMASKAISITRGQDKGPHEARRTFMAQAQSLYLSAAELLKPLGPSASAPSAPAPKAAPGQQP